MSPRSFASALLLSLFLFCTVKNTYANESTVDDGPGPWSYLPVKIPTPLSDMSVAIMLTLNDNGNTQQRIILTGGCDSADGHVYFNETDWALCLSISSKVSSLHTLL